MELKHAKNLIAVQSLAIIILSILLYGYSMGELEPEEPELTENKFAEHTFDINAGYTAAGNFYDIDYTSATIKFIWNIYNPLEEVNTQRAFIVLTVYESWGDGYTMYIIHQYTTLDYNGEISFKYAGNGTDFNHRIEFVIGYLYGIMHEPMSYIVNTQIIDNS